MVILAPIIYIAMTVLVKMEHVYPLSLFLFHRLLLNAQCSFVMNLNPPLYKSTWQMERSVTLRRRDNVLIIMNVSRAPASSFLNPTPQVAVMEIIAPSETNVLVHLTCVSLGVPRIVLPSIPNAVPVFVWPQAASVRHKQPMKEGHVTQITTRVLLWMFVVIKVVLQEISRIVPI